MDLVHPDLSLPPRQALARLPTPLEPCRRIAAGTGLDLWVKRDDLTGVALSGNKVRKLEFLVADALALGADTLITCGAVTSNHARATAIAAARVGMRSALLLRGVPPAIPDGNLLLDRYVGADCTFISPEVWPERDQYMEDIRARLAAEGRRGYVIPEGGSNALGALGYVLAVQELLAQAKAQGVDIRRIVHATGSGGTSAGLALGCAAQGRADIDVLGVAVCDDAPYFDGVLTRILDETVAAGYASRALATSARWQILEGYQGRGYAQTTPTEMEAHGRLARSEGLIVDPVYSGKAFAAVLAEQAAGRFAAEGATVFLHTGGIFGLFSFAAELPDPDRGSAPPGA
jgi:D-cysteine desulfhydrase